MRRSRTALPFGSRMLRHCTHANLRRPARPQQSIHNLLRMRMQQLVRLRLRARRLEHGCQGGDHVLPLVCALNRERAEEDGEQLVVSYRRGSPSSKGNSPCAGPRDTATPERAAAAPQKPANTAHAQLRSRPPHQRAAWGGGSSTVSARTASVISLRRYLSPPSQSGGTGASSPATRRGCRTRSPSRVRRRPRCRAGRARAQRQCRRVRSEGARGLS